MGVPTGLFSLQTAKDLRNKLEADYTRLETNPMDVYAAFDFFVTAEHIVDWMYPSSASDRKKMRNGDVLLQLCSHIASGSKHFHATDQRHTSMSDTRVRKGAIFGTFRFGEVKYNQQPALEIVLDGGARTKFGNSIEVLELAKLVIYYWRQQSLS